MDLTPAAAGALTWMLIEWIKHGKPSGLGAITGMIAGLATITPASGSVGPAGALLVGLSGGVICYFATNYLKQVIRIDDALDVFPVHGIGGMVGTFLAGILVSDRCKHSDPAYIRPMKAVGSVFD